MALLIKTGFVPNDNDATNDILDLQRASHANDLVLQKEYTSDVRTLLFAFPFSLEKVALLSTQRVAADFFLTLLLFASVSWRSSCLLFTTPGIAGSTGISSFFSGVFNNGVNVFKFVRRNSMTVFHLTCSLLCGFSCFLFLLCVLFLSNFAHRRPYFWPDRCGSRRDLNFGQAAICQ